MRSWNHKNARHWIGNVMRNIAVILVDTAEHIDPQPDADWWGAFTIYGSDGQVTKAWTASSSGPIKWHRTG